MPARTHYYTCISADQAEHVLSKKAVMYNSAMETAVSLPPELQRTLRELRDSYRGQLLERRQELQQAWQQLIRETWHERSLQNFHRILHDIAGTSGTFGFEQLSQYSRELTRSIRQYLEPGQAPPDHIFTVFLSLFEQLERSMVEAAYNSTYNPDNSQVLRQLQENFTICLLSSHKQDELVQQLQHYGYQSQNLLLEAGYVQRVLEANPQLIIADISSTDIDSDLAYLQQLPTSFRRQRPLLVVANRDDIHTRLAAVRAGARAFFTMPLDIAELIDTLNGFAQHPTVTPYRVLIIENEPHLAKLYVATLEYANMQCQHIADPLHIMPALVEFRPELILLDLYMPTCNGWELAQVIRQQRAYVSIPIVFLSSEHDTQRQLEAMRLGGDDFLTKPVAPHYLIASIQARAARSRELRHFIERDSLTGLFNHGKITEQIEVELSRARRRNRPLSLVLLDLDHFKGVNDRYGHPAGDRVLKSFAELLKQRMRRSDILGRYGGEEFAILLPDTSASDAATVLSELHKRFSALHHYAGNERFQVNFSAGLASYPPHQQADSLHEAADKALYRAKNQGRNCTIVDEASQTEN